ncbi:hypothetical protein Tco_0079272 [Tanacetum coccineum]
MMDVKVQHEDSSIQTSPLLTVPETTTSTTAFPDSKTLSAIHLRVSNLEKEVKELKNVDHSSTLLATIKSEVSNAVQEYLGTSLDDALYKSAQAEETVFEAEDSQVPWNQGDDMGNTDEPPIVNIDLKDWFKNPERPPTPDPEWKECKIVENKPTQSYVELKYNMEECYKALTDQLDFDYFFNNDLAHLHGESTSKTYTTSLTKAKAAKYDLPRVEDIVPNLWNPIKVAYDKQALLVTNVKVNIWYGYGHLEEIEVRRSDQQLYKFMEGGFPQLHLNDTEDMLLLVVQHKLFNLKRDIIVHLAATLHPQGVIYEDKLNRKRLIHSDELYKFSDGTLQSVRDILHDMATNLRMGYNKAMPKRK